MTSKKKNSLWGNKFWKMLKALKSISLDILLMSITHRSSEIIRPSSEVKNVFAVRFIWTHAYFMSFSFSFPDKTGLSNNTTEERGKEGHYGWNNACAATEDDGKSSHCTKSLINRLNEWHFLANSIIIDHQQYTKCAQTAMHSQLNDKLIVIAIQIC